MRACGLTARHSIGVGETPGSIPGESSIMDISNQFQDLMSKDRNYEEAVYFALHNSQGRVWLIGGSVYKNLAHLLYNTPIAETDFDFIVEYADAKLRIPSGWELTKNHYGNPKIVGRKYSIDFVPLDNIDSIIRRGLEPTIENFLTGTPLNVQSVVYGVLEKELIGSIGLKALAEKTVAPNDKEQLEIYAARKEKTKEEIIQKTAESLGFKPLF